MKIIDLSPEHEKIYFCCLEDWSDEMKEAGDHKQHWYECMKDKGARVKLAVDDNGTVGGMIQYVPVEYSMFSGKDLYVVLCIWVHGYKEGRGDFRKRGMGTALLKAAEEDCMQLGTGGLVTWGLLIPVFMRASWFKKHGYKAVAREGMMQLLWKPFRENVVPPKFKKPVKLPGKGEDKVNISLFRNGWCPAANMSYERALRAAAEFEGKVEIKEYDTKDAAIMEEWGIFDGLYIEGKEVPTGPPVTYEKAKRKIEKNVKKRKLV